MLSHCFLDFSVGVGAFVIGLSQISSFFTLHIPAEKLIGKSQRPQNKTFKRGASPGVSDELLDNTQ